MIREIVRNKFKDNLGLIIDEVIAYCGEEYRDQIIDKLKNIQISLVEDKGAYSFEDGEVYVGDEPVCIKGDNPHIIIPLSFMGDEHGNVVLVHLLLHVVGEESFVKDGKDAFNEVIVDYMANDIAKQLEKKKINLTVVSPNYESNSFYSKMFDEISEFYVSNKQKIIDSRMGKTISFNDEINGYIEATQSVVDKVFFTEEVEKFNFRAR